ncbi:MAG: deoxyribonuclease IV [Deferribacteraceae bacterium]|jgi:deoxyribonuclease-4|nr:deoxyribonuclease IV [Deferribacteraceae bacterium]
MIIGAHESVNGGVYKALERAEEDGCQAVQLFVTVPNRWHHPPLTDKDIKLYQERSAIFGAGAVTAHATYLINLASPKDDVRKRSVNCLKDELLRCDALGIPYYVLHPGSPLDSGYEAGIKQICRGLDEVYKSGVKVMVLLETTSGGGNTIGRKLEEIAEIIDKAESSDKLGICLDSCHMFSAGYDLLKKYDSIMEYVFSLFGDKLKVFHINDTKHPFASGKDRHELIGKGFLGLDFFSELVNDTRLKDVLGILETPAERYKEEIENLKALVKS